MPGMRRKSLSSIVLLAIENTVDGTVRLNDFINRPHLYTFGSGGDYPLKKTSLSKAIERLRLKKMIEQATESEDEIILRLTDPGRDRAFWLKIAQDTKEWDGRWRLVFWDIPEDHKEIRNLLRSKLKQFGFKRWQKSVWVTKKNCTDLLRRFVKDIGVEDWVWVIESDNVGKLRFEF